MDKGDSLYPGSTIDLSDQVPYLDADELRGAEYEAERLWTPQSVGVIRLALVALWLLTLMAMSFLLVTYAARQVRAESDLKRR
jgi:hypothetical protein